MSTIRQTFISACFVTVCAMPANADETPLDALPAVTWNESVLHVAEVEDGFLTLKGLRTVTMMHIAMHDALNAIAARYRPYALEITNKRADPVAAATQAAFVVASRQYPDQAGRFESLRSKILAAGSIGPSLSAGIELGNAAAFAILELRSDDGWDTEADYRWHPMAPGVYAEFNEHSGTPDGFVFGAGWGEAQGFALSKPDQFRSPPPPAIESDAYALAFNEVKNVGRLQTMSRTPDQAHLAFWWKEFVESSHNRLARDLANKEQLDLVDATRLFALLNISIYDAYVSSFNNKFFYNHWRPYTAIRWAANDGNAATQADETWNNLHRHTYAFPSYPSAHGTACAAAMTVFAAVFAEDYDFTMRIPLVDVAGPLSGKMQMHPPTRHFNSFPEAAMDCALSRVYLGIHFRYDSTEGLSLGQKVGENVVTRLLLAN